MSAQKGHIYWVDMHPRDPASAGIATVRFAGGAVQSSYYREDNGQHYRAGLVAAPRFGARIGFGDQGFSGQTIAQSARIQIAPAQADVLDMVAGYYWDGADITIDGQPEGRAGQMGAVTRVFTGTIASHSLSDGVLNLTIADLSTRLDKPVCDMRFQGTGGIEGGEEAKGRTKRCSFGYVFNVEGRLLDPANSIYEFGDPGQPLSAFSALRDKGRTGPFAVIAWQGSIAETLAALQASQPVQGGGVVAPSIAAAKWWTEPSGPLTADIIGTPGTGGSMAVAALINTISGRFDGPQVTGLQAAIGLRPAVAGIHVGDESTTGAQVIDRLALGSSLIWVAAPSGAIRLLPWTFDSGDAAVLQGQFSGRERAHAPHYRRRVGFQANNRVHGEAEIAESIRLDDGVLFESLRPAEANATAGAVIPDPQTYVPGDPYPGFVRDSAGNVRNPGELLNSEIELTAAGRLQYRPLPDVAPQVLGQITLPDIGAVGQAALDRAQDDIDKVAGALAFALSETSQTRETLRDAGFFVDPATGQVRIHAIEQTRERVSAAEITLNGALASINLRATTNYVDEQLALAVFDPSQIADLTNVFLRLGAAEVDIDGLAATVTSLATVQELSLVSGRVTSAETAIDALQGTITSKVDTTTFDALASRVTNAETVLTAIGDTAQISNAVSATRLLEQAQDAQTEAGLLALLQGDRNHRNQIAAVAAARQDLTARIIDSNAVQAEFRLALQVRLGSAESQIGEERIARAEQGRVLASQISNLGVRIDGDLGLLQADIDNTKQAVLDETGALATQVEALTASIDGVGSQVQQDAQASVARDGELLAGISREATVLRGSRNSLDDLVEQVMTGLLLNDRANRNAGDALGFVREEITALLTSEISGVVSRLVAMGLRVGDTEGSIRELDRVVIENNTALVQSVNTLALNVERTGQDLAAEVTARGQALTAEQQARADAINQRANDLINIINQETGVLAGNIGNLQDGLSNAYLEIDAAELARLQGDQAEAQARGQALTAEQQTRINAINAEREARLAEIETERQARATQISGSIQAERVLWQDGDNILAGSITTLNTRVNDNSATLVQFGESIDGLRTRWGARIDINGRVSGFVQNATAGQTDSTFVSDTFSVVDPDTGVAFLSADQDGLRLQNGKVVMDNGANMLVLGAGFGVDSQFVMWFGPSRAIHLCNRADAGFYLDVSGDGEYGLRLGSNFYKNSGTGTSLADNAQIVVGPFVTAGGARQVSIGYQYRRAVQITDAFGYTGVPRTVIRVERQTGSGGFEQVGDFTFNGAATGESGAGPTEPGSAQITINGSASLTDTSAVPGDVTYRASIISRAVGGLTSTVSLEDSLTQQVTMISTEQIV